MITDKTKIKWSDESKKNKNSDFTTIIKKILSELPTKRFRPCINILLKFIRKVSLNLPNPTMNKR